MSIIEEMHTEVDFSLKKHLITAENITFKRDLDDFDNRKTANEVDRDWDQKLTIKTHSHIKSEEENLETHTEVNFSLKNHPFTEENIIVKREPDDFDIRQTANEVHQDLDWKSTVKILSHIKSEDENFIDSPDLVSHEELNVKREDDVEQSDNRSKNHKVWRKSKDQIKIHKCPDCSYQSKHKRNVKEHSIKHRRPNEIEWHRCTECLYKTEWKQSLIRHALVHNETPHFEMFKCAHCVYETTRKQTLKEHLRVLHAENTARIYCPEPECPFKTRRKSSLKLHLRTHANPDQLEWFKCEHCSYKANRKFNLKQHAFTHNMDDAKWLQCTFCSYKTWRKSSFQRHQMKRHQE